MITIVTIDSNGGFSGFTRSDKTLKDLKEIKGVNGATCYEISGAEYEKLARGGNCVITDGGPIVSDAPAEELERQRLANISVNREAEMPPAGDMIDAIMKALSAQNLIPVGSELESKEAERQAVKVKYPKKDGT